MRDIKHFADMVRKIVDQNQRYDLSVGEIRQLFDMANEYERVCTSYLAGFEAGMRYQNEELKPIDID